MKYSNSNRTNVYRSPSSFSPPLPSPFHPSSLQEQKPLLSGHYRKYHHCYNVTFAASSLRFLTKISRTFAKQLAVICFIRALCACNASDALKQCFVVYLFESMRCKVYAQLVAEVYARLSNFKYLKTAEEQVGTF